MSSYRRAEGVVFREVDGEAFLVAPNDVELFHLNPIGTAIWRALGEPTSPREVAALLHAAFPREDRNRITRDVTAMFARLKQGGFITPA
ncbi:MAG: hypothetical protein A2516_03185 [Alphaproteobacteria bacterium RIFOXYD12_FULL_60_8]|nr:MAG: hypothetical protein A2516_03185 [Alphaproteobacteria bacterium RIFOXYD12_FULL_60_8]